MAGKMSKPERPMPTPLQCPFCGGSKFAATYSGEVFEPHKYLPKSVIAEYGEDHDLFVADVNSETGYPYVRCLCGCCGPKAKAPKKDHREAVRRAVVAWNDRTPEQGRLEL